MAVSGSEIVTLAEKLRGVPYQWGGTTTAGLDCSGLVQLVYREAGFTNVPRTSEDQWRWVDRIPADQARPGDLVFFGGSGYAGSAGSPGHVGILVAPGTVQHGPEMIDAAHTGTVVQIQGYGPAGVVGYGRAPGAAPGAATGGGGGGGGGILSWPSDITGFFSDADHALGTASAVALAFFRPSTYIRIAVGGLAVLLLIAGLIFLVRAASDG